MQQTLSGRSARLFAVSGLLRAALAALLVAGFMLPPSIAQTCLGTTLGAAYLALAHYAGAAALGANYAVTAGIATGANVDRSHCTDLSQPVADVIAYANATTGTHSNAGKYFFANQTTDGTTSVSAEAMAILKDIGGQTDVFGKSYNLASGSPGADVYGNSRPFQTQPNVTLIVGLDYFNMPADNIVYNRGPIMDLINSPSYPSGHTTYGYMGSLVLAVLVPERYQ